MSKRGFVRGPRNWCTSGAACAGGRRTAAGTARARAAQHPADDRAAGAVGRHHRHPRRDVHLGRSVPAVRLLPDDRSGRLRRADVQRPIRPRAPHQLGRAGKAAPHLSAPARRGPRRGPARSAGATPKPAVRARRPAGAGHRHRRAANVGAPPGRSRFSRCASGYWSAIDRRLGGVTAVAGGSRRRGTRTGDRPCAAGLHPRAEQDPGHRQGSEPAVQTRLQLRRRRPRRNCTGSCARCCARWPSTTARATSS